MGSSIRGISTTAKAVGACDARLGPSDPVGPRDSAQTERVARTRICAVLTQTGGSAICFVSYWPDHISIDACVCDPAALAVGEAAEKAVIEHVTQSALSRGCTDIRLANSGDRFFQLDGMSPAASLGDTGNTFYERCHFYPNPMDPAGPCDTVFRSTLRYRAP
jgi:hypothetical protein